MRILLHKRVCRMPPKKAKSDRTELKQAEKKESDTGALPDLAVPVQQQQADGRIRGGVSGRVIRDGPAAREASQPLDLGRNRPCPCGSGKKFKRCCIAKQAN